MVDFMVTPKFLAFDNKERALPTGNHLEELDGLLSSGKFGRTSIWLFVDEFSTTIILADFSSLWLLS